MDTLLVVLQAVVVLGAIFLGVRMGGIGLGLWGAAGTAVLVFGFQLDPGSPPVDAFFIIIAVITASAAMQAAGGIDWLVKIASRIIQANPKRITHCGAVGLVRFHRRRGNREHLFRAHPGHPRDRLSQRHPSREAFGLIHRHLRSWDHGQPGFGGDGGLPDPAARGLHPRGHSQDHHSGGDRLVHRDRARSAADRQGAVGGPGVPPARRGGRGRGSREGHGQAARPPPERQPSLRRQLGRRHRRPVGPRSRPRIARPRRRRAAPAPGLGTPGRATFGADLPGRSGHHRPHGSVRGTAPDRRFGGGGSTPEHDRRHRAGDVHCGLDHPARRSHRPGCRC